MTLEMERWRKTGRVEEGLKGWMGWKGIPRGLLASASYDEEEKRKKCEGRGRRGGEVFIPFEEHQRRRLVNTMGESSQATVQASQ